MFDLTVLVGERGTGRTTTVLDDAIEYVTLESYRNVRAVIVSPYPRAARDALNRRDIPDSVRRRIAVIPFARHGLDRVRGFDRHAIKTWVDDIDGTDEGIWTDWLQQLPGLQYVTASTTLRESELVRQFYAAQHMAAEERHRRQADAERERDTKDALMFTWMRLKIEGKL